MDETVVLSAQEHQVLHRRRTPVGPVGHVVRVAPGSGADAPWEPAAPSRTTTARWTGIGTAAVRRPTSSGWDRPRVITLVTAASQGILRAASGVILPTSSISQGRPTRPSNASSDTVTLMWGRSPATIGRSEDSSHSLHISPKASARSWAKLRGSSPARVSASTTLRRAEMRVCPVSGSRSPSIRTIRTASAKRTAVSGRGAAVRRRPPAPGPRPVASTRRPRRVAGSRGFSPHPRAFPQPPRKPRGWTVGRHQHLHGRRGWLAGEERLPRRGHLPEGPREADLARSGWEGHSVPVREPGGSREVPFPPEAARRLISASSLSRSA